MRQRQIIIGIAFLLATFSMVLSTLAFRGGPKGGWNGSIASNNTADSCMMCHGSAVGSGSVQIIGAPSDYVPNTIYDLIVRISDPSTDQVGAGFQLSVEDDNGIHVGSLIISDSINTQDAPIFMPSEAGWVSHTSTGVDNAIAMWQAMGNSADYTVQWQAPAGDVGAVHFFAAGNAVNGNFSPSGDFVYLTSVIAQPQQQPVCDDTIACTDDTFDGAMCVFTANDANCADDGVFCNGLEFCDSASGCTSTGSPCPQNTMCDEQRRVCAECLIDGDCNDGVACTVDTCVSGSCSIIPDSNLCPDNGSFCDGVEVCIAATGCTSINKPCDTGLFCNEANQTCDACDPALPCDDNDICTTNDTCTAGQCAGTSIPNCCVNVADCADADPCTDEACTANQCIFTLSAMCIEPADADMDNDGVTDDKDECGNTDPGVAVDEFGCSCMQLDTDNDGVDDCSDDCPNSTAVSQVDNTGCSADQRDDDKDSIPNADDQCPATPSDDQADETGCSASQLETDNADQVIPDMPNPPVSMPGGFSLCGTFGLLTLISMLTGLAAMGFISKRKT